MTPIRASSVVFMCIYLSGLGGLSPVWGQSLQESLSQSFHAEIQALNTGDLEAAVSSAHEKIVLYGLYSPFPIEGKEAFGQAVKEYFEIHASAVLELVHPQYLVAGETGAAWGHYQLLTTLKGGTSATSYGQYMLTYARPAGEWLIISLHFAPLPGPH